MPIEDFGLILEAIETISLVGFLIVSLRYLDSEKDIERKRADERTEDIITDWKALRGIEDRDSQR